jgi:hypothetical protein
VLTAKQAARLRGLTNYTVECAEKNATGHEWCDADAERFERDFTKAKMDLETEIRKLTEPKAK